MPLFNSVQEFLEAKEGEHIQFKEAKNRFSFLKKRPSVVVPCQMMVAVRWYLVLQISGLEV